MLEFDPLKLQLSSMPKQLPFPCLCLLMKKLKLYASSLLPTTRLSQLHYDPFHHRSWYYKVRPTYVDHDYDDDFHVLRLFVMFIYHGYMDPDHYKDSKVLCGESSFAINDILLPFQQEIKDLLAENTPFVCRKNAFMDCLLSFASQLSHITRSMIPNKFQPTLKTIAPATSADALICSTGSQLLRLVNIPIYAVPTVNFESPNQFLLPFKLVKSTPSPCL